MKYFDWDIGKNEDLKNARDVSFEEVILAILEDKILQIIDHPNQKKYQGQKIYVVEIDDYAYLVPFVEDEKKIFLKTVFPSRKYTKIFIEKGGV